jgi:hypothetical protein
MTAGTAGAAPQNDSKTLKPQGKLRHRVPGTHALNPHQVHVQFLVAIFPSPEVQRHRRQFVNNRDGESGLGEVDALQISAASIAHVYPYVRDFRGRVECDLRFS